ncbi:MAG: ribbon-helix-helix domain-containing protein [Planctomycetota bacterium]
MTTFSISLPNQIANQVDSETQKQGFATRSEFIRTLLRRYFTQELPFVPFTPRPLNEIKLELAQTGKYSQEFIESVIKGLSQSSPYAR